MRRIPRLLRLLSICIVLALLPCLAGAEILYRVIPSPNGDRLTVEMDFPVSTATVDVQMPSWSPGLYVIENYWKDLHDVSATDAAGKALSVAHPRDDTWRIATAGQKWIKVHYERPISRAMERVGMFACSDHSFRWSSM